MKRQTRLLLLTLGLLLGALGWQAIALSTPAARAWRTTTGHTARPAAAPLFTTIVVNSLADTTANDGACTLREAIAAANTNTASGVAAGECQAGMDGADTISFAPTAAGTIVLTQGQLEVSQDVTIQGPGANLLTISGNNASRVFFINSGVTATLAALTIANGRVRDNQGGGGIYNRGTLTVTSSTISGNAVNGGGGLSSNNLGGGIYSSGTLTVTSSTISGNAASGGGNSNNRGGGINNDSGTLIVTSSTISGNAASGGQRSASLGGGISNNGTLIVTSSTLSDNAVSGDDNSDNRGGGINNDSGTVQPGNTIIAGNRADDGPDVFGTVTSRGYNLVGNSADSSGFTATGDQLNVDPRLGPLANNGGPTLTQRPLPGSPAIDKGSSFGLASDQRGSLRPVDDATLANATGGDGADIGAVETQSAPTTPTCPPITAQVSGGGTIRPGQTTSVVVTVTGGTAPYTVTLSNNGGTLTASSPLSFTLGPQATTTYTVTAGTDANGSPVIPVGSATITVDSTPLTITCPPNQTSIVAGTSGPVTYPAPTVNDTRATFSCTPASGATFPLGATAVNCTATQGGNTAACSFTVTVLQARPALKNLTRLIGHLELANSNLERGQTATACTNLQNYINQVNGLVSAGQLTQAQGQALISYVNQIRNAVGCAGGPFAT